jgi:4-aminobutyrate aminotransferase
MNSSQVIASRKAHLLPGLAYFYDKPPLFVRGEMQYLYDDSGKRYTDFFAGVSVMNCGHSNPFILERMHHQLENLQHTTQVYLTAPVAELAERIAGVMPIENPISFFVNSGSEANEGALLLARHFTGRPGLLALTGGLHGRTYLTMAVTHIPMWRADPFPPQDVAFIENAPDEAGARRSLAALKALLEKEPGRYAALIAEIIQGNAGIVTPPAFYFRELHAILKRHGVLFIADEIQTGFGRTGTMFACEKYGVVPDIITYAKALGNGTPIGGFSASREIGGAFTKPTASTLGGNPVSATAALAVLDYIKREDLCAKAESLGEILRGALLELQKKHPVIREVRGAGLMLGAELRSGEGEPLPQKVDAVLEAMKDRGFIIGKNGLHRNVLAFQPPLVINETDIREMIEALDGVLKTD